MNSVSKVDKMKLRFKNKCKITNRNIPVKTFETACIYIQARFACLRCAAGGQFVSAALGAWVHID